MATLGPMAGYMLSSKATSLFVDFDRVDPDLIPDIPQYDPRWIGAWWLGFLTCGGLLVLISIPMFLYPKRMPVPSSSSSAETEKSDTEVDNNNKVEDLTDGIFKKGTKDAGLVEGMKSKIFKVVYISTYIVVFPIGTKDP